MKAVRLHAYDKRPQIDEVPEPTITDPHDVIIAVAGAGLCRTDLNIQQGMFAPLAPIPMPFTLGHENAGRVYAVGPAVERVRVGDAVICHPHPGCGTCTACRLDDNTRCAQGLRFPGLSCDGGFAELFRSTERAVVTLPPGLDPADAAALADAGVTVQYVVRRAIPQLGVGSHVAVVGIGGLGRIAVQALRALTPAEIIAVDVDPDAVRLAAGCGARHGVHATGREVAVVRSITGGLGAEVVIDFVGAGPPALGMLRTGGTYYLVGYGGLLLALTVQVLRGRITVVDNAVGSREDLVALLELAAAGLVRVPSTVYRFDAIDDAFDDLEPGRTRGRRVLVP